MSRLDTTEAAPTACIDFLKTLMISTVQKLNSEINADVISRELDAQHSIMDIIRKFICIGNPGVDTIVDEAFRETRTLYVYTDTEISEELRLGKQNANLLLSCGTFPLLILNADTKCPTYLETLGSYFPLLAWLMVDERLEDLLLFFAKEKELDFLAPSERFPNIFLWLNEVYSTTTDTTLRERILNNILLLIKHCPEFLSAPPLEPEAFVVKSEGTSASGIVIPPPLIDAHSLLVGMVQKFLGKAHIEEIDAILFLFDVLNINASTMKSEFVHACATESRTFLKQWVMLLYRMDRSYKRNPVTARQSPEQSRQLCICARKATCIFWLMRHYKVHPADNFDLFYNCETMSSDIDPAQILFFWLEIQMEPSTPPSQDVIDTSVSAVFRVTLKKLANSDVTEPPSTEYKNKERIEYLHTLFEILLAKETFHPVLSEVMNRLPYDAPAIDYFNEWLNYWKKAQAGQSYTDIDIKNINKVGIQIVQIHFMKITLAYKKKDQLYTYLATLFEPHKLSKDSLPIVMTELYSQDVLSKLTEQQKTVIYDFSAAGFIATIAKSEKERAALILKYVAQVMPINKLSAWVAFAVKLPVDSSTWQSVIEHYSQEADSFSILIQALLMHHATIPLKIIFERLNEKTPEFLISFFEQALKNKLYSAAFSILNFSSPNEAPVSKKFRHPHQKAILQIYFSYFSEFCKYKEEIIRYDFSKKEKADPFFQHPPHPRNFYSYVKFGCHFELECERAYLESVWHALKTSVGDKTEIENIFFEVLSKMKELPDDLLKELMSSGSPFFLLNLMCQNEKRYFHPALQMLWPSRLKELLAIANPEQYITIFLSTLTTSNEPLKAALLKEPIAHQIIRNEDALKECFLAVFDSNVSHHDKLFFAWRNIELLKTEYCPKREKDTAVLKVFAAIQEKSEAKINAALDTLLTLGPIKSTFCIPKEWIHSKETGSLYVLDFLLQADLSLDALKNILGKVSYRYGAVDYLEKWTKEYGVVKTDREKHILKNAILAILFAKASDIPDQAIVSTINTIAVNITPSELGHIADVSEIPIWLLGQCLEHPSFTDKKFNTAKKNLQTAVERRFLHQCIFSEAESKWLIRQFGKSELKRRLRKENQYNLTCLFKNDKTILKVVPPSKEDEKFKEWKQACYPHCATLLGKMLLIDIADEINNGKIHTEVFFEYYRENYRDDVFNIKFIAALVPLLEWPTQEKFARMYFNVNGFSNAELQKECASNRVFKEFCSTYLPKDSPLRSQSIFETRARTMADGSGASLQPSSSSQAAFSVLKS